MKKKKFCISLDGHTCKFLRGYLIAISLDGHICKLLRGYPIAISLAGHICWRRQQVMSKPDGMIRIFYDVVSKHGVLALSANQLKSFN